MGNFGDRRHPKTIAPLAPKIANCSLTFLVITYEVTSQPSAQAGGFATAHQNEPERALPLLPHDADDRSIPRTFAAVDRGKPVPFERVQCPVLAAVARSAVTE
jgi:hypothetical protein